MKTLIREEKRKEIHYLIFLIVLLAVLLAAMYSATVITNEMFLIFSLIFLWDICQILWAVSNIRRLNKIGKEYK